MSSDSKSMNFLLDLENVSVLKNHVLFENNEKEKPFFEKRANLNRLIKTIYENKTPFQCEKRANLNRHIRTIYENKTPFQCKACDDRFSEQVSLRAHITEVHEGKKGKSLKNVGNKPCKCSGCGETFNSTFSLSMHKRYCADSSTLHEEKQDNFGKYNYNFILKCHMKKTCDVIARERRSKSHLEKN